MLVAILVICYVLVLRYFDQKNRERDRIKAGLAVALGPADYETLKKTLMEISARLTALETECRELAARSGGVR
ncbi:MAG TPA: hypothetical protein VMT75_02530 [Candidatus Saccharimonadales bacterium]|nr:hypothetical protein [Candidatus Saccharimonadales bacterium]